MQQQTGVPFMHIIMVQPGIIMAVMQSQQASIIFCAIMSPLVQVMTQPMSVISHIVMPMVMLQQQHIMPFIMQQQLIIAFGIIMQRFCIMAADILSSHMHVTFMPLGIFSKIIVQRGIIIGLGMPGIAPVMGMFIIPTLPGMFVPMLVVLVIIPRSVVVVFIGFLG